MYGKFKQLFTHTSKEEEDIKEGFDNLAETVDRYQKAFNQQIKLALRTNNVYIEIPRGKETKLQSGIRIDLQYYVLTYGKLVKANLKIVPASPGEDWHPEPPVLEEWRQRYISGPPIPYLPLDHPANRIPPLPTPKPANLDDTGFASIGDQSTSISTTPLADPTLTLPKEVVTSDKDPPAPQQPQQQDERQLLPPPLLPQILPPTQTNDNLPPGQPPIPPTNTNTDQQQTMVPPTKLSKLKLPPWMPKNAKAWFNLLELTFSKENIVSEEDKCLAILTFVPPDATSKLGTIAWKSTYAEGDYAKIRDKLVAMYTESDDAKITKLLHKESLGDQKPSELYIKMLNLAGSITTTQIPEKLIFNRWMNELPTELISYVQNYSNIWDSSLHLPGVDALHEMLLKRQAAVSKITAIDRPRYQRGGEKQRSRSPSKGRSNSTNRQRGNAKSQRKGRKPRDYPENCKQCWYHWMYGAQARKCHREHCNYRSENDHQ